jgi:hypothetical protein
MIYDVRLMFLVLPGYTATTTCGSVPRQKQRIQDILFFGTRLGAMKMGWRGTGCIQYVFLVRAVHCSFFLWIPCANTNVENRLGLCRFDLADYHGYVQLMLFYYFQLGRCADIWTMSVRRYLLHPLLVLSYFDCSSVAICRKSQALMTCHDCFESSYLLIYVVRIYCLQVNL